MRLMGLFALMPATMLLTIRYFVMYVNERADRPGLKRYGSLVSALLLIVAILVLLAGLAVLITGVRPACPFLHQPAVNIIP